MPLALFDGPGLTSEKSRKYSQVQSTEPESDCKSFPAGWKDFNLPRRSACWRRNHYRSRKLCTSTNIASTPIGSPGGRCSASSPRALLSRKRRMLTAIRRPPCQPPAAGRCQSCLIATGPPSRLALADQTRLRGLSLAGRLIPRSRGSGDEARSKRRRDRAR